MVSTRSRAFSTAIIKEALMDVICDYSLWLLQNYSSPDSHLLTLAGASKLLWQCQAREIELSETF